MESPGDLPCGSIQLQRAGGLPVGPIHLVRYPPGGAREFLVFWPDKLTLRIPGRSYEVTACGRSFEWGMRSTIKSPAYSEVISVQQRPAICGNGGINMQEITCTMDVFSVS